ncbi:unnamed protein product, partial [Timema podura]|nr:unnamed protein product [Timema podura]
MAGKPEAPQHHVQHQPSVQNVVVYLSNDNLAYATAVNQQNVATSYHQQTQQNGGTAVSFANAPQSVASIAPPKNIGKFQVKTQDFSSNGFVGRHNNVALQQHTGFY